MMDREKNQEQLIEELTAARQRIAGLENLLIKEYGPRKPWESTAGRTPAQAQTARLAKEKFLADLSHELRTPLNAIMGFSQLLDRARNENERREYAAYIQRGADHLLALIDHSLEEEPLPARPEPAVSK